MKIGKIISVSELGVEILTDGAEVRYRDMLYTEPVSYTQLMWHSTRTSSLWNSVII